MTKNSERNPGSCRTMANSSKWRAAMERQEGPTNPGGTNLPVRADKCGGHRQDLCGCARPLFLGGAPPLMTPPATARRSPDAPRVDPTVALISVALMTTFLDVALVILKEVHPPNPQWYDKLFAWAMEHLMEFHRKKAGEGLPAEDCSMDFVVGTLVLCSVKDVRATLEEVLRVLKPGGRFIFLEHVAALDGTPLRLLQGILNPLQKFFADGCHLNRETGKEISKAGFSDVDLNMSFVPGLALLSPHVYGVAIK
ncbi:uncharacterized protein LOC116247368 isoform X4 [Nymphaea colorata]|uniref:uncharacterized protein LOC116247368 isoform X4 n=1 Tax=Nymphaea colorata TaxID=210225 RepID=UPI00214E437E|nr:uncharacterized protein LOC116247368 isoform X4 [Nymphaea colorata]